MICANCGTKNNEGVDFCPNCGVLIKQTVGDNASVAPTPPPVGSQDSGYTSSTYHPASEWFDANSEVRGKKFLYVVGILSIIGGGMNIMLFVMSMATAEQFFSDLNATIVFALFAGIYQLILGIAGVKFCKVAKKAPMLYAMGIVALVIPLVNIITSITIYGATFGFAGIVGFVLPALFIVGAKMNMSSTTK
jgi:hypothetical protein